jgi:hypothetical protein
MGHWQIRGPLSGGSVSRSAPVAADWKNTNMPHGLPWRILLCQSRDSEPFGAPHTKSCVCYRKVHRMKGLRVGAPSRTAPEGVEGLSELHLHSDALRISKHARRKGGVNTAVASQHAHGNL